MAIDLNILPDEGDGHPIPDQNEPPPDKGDEIHNLTKDKVHIMVDDEVHRPQGAQSHLLQQEEQIDVYVHRLPDLNADASQLQYPLPDLNVDASELQPPNEDMMEYTDAMDIDFHEDEFEDLDFEHDHGNENIAHQSRNFTEAERHAIYAALVERSVRGRLKRKTTTRVAEMFQVSRYQVQRVWRRVKECHAQGIPVDVRSRRPKNCGRKKIQADLSEVLNIPLHRRTTIRSLAEAIGVTKSTLHRWFKEGQLQRHSNTLKPLLKEANKKERLQWCISMLDPRTLPHEPKFIEMENIIHLDEKWYYTTKKDRTYYLLQEEPYRTVQNKNSIGKVMILAAVARPRYDDKGNCTFDGKIGVWAFIRKEPAKRRSRNRGRGTLVTKPMKVDRDIMRSFMIAKVLPAIVSRWPREDARKTIWIQQDNAPSHVPMHDEQVAVAVAQTGLDIRIINQPPTSPDMNVPDPGLFASLQSLAYGTISRNMDELVENVQKEFDEYDPSTLNRIFLTLQGCLIEVMKGGGGNRYKIPHMSKDRLEALGMLPKSLSVDQRLYEHLMESLSN